MRLPASLPRAVFSFRLKSAALPLAAPSLIGIQIATMLLFASHILFATLQDSDSNLDCCASSKNIDM